MAMALRESARETLPQIRRCDGTGCRAFEVTAAVSGMFVNVSAVGGGER